MSEGTVFIFIPDTLPKTGSGFLSGFVFDKLEQCEIFITSDKLNSEEIHHIGYCGSTTAKTDNQVYRLYIDHDTDGFLKINSILYNNNKFSTLIITYYDYRSFCTSELLQTSCDSTDHFSVLSNALHKTSYTNNHTQWNETQVDWVISRSFASVLRTSHTARLMSDSIRTIQWAVKRIHNERKISLPVGNAIVARFVDIALGILMLLWLWPSSRAIDGTADALVERLRQLLHDQLMGSPVGLKLNHALNSALGRFFLYHIALWRAFIATAVTWTTPGAVLWTTRTLASFGLSFQAALAADALALATFHVYCIYVYAARLYGAQIRGLASLWWLFVGRKRNPLRARVDSCYYTHRQLFVGTLAFTILLFLLPTIALYYAVFTALRLALSIADRTLSVVYRTILRLPVYVTCLWAMDSARTRNTIHVLPTRPPVCSPNVGCAAPGHRTLHIIALYATLRSGNWRDCVNEAGRICDRQQYEDENQNDVYGFASFGTLVRSVALGKLM